MCFSLWVAPCYFSSLVGSRFRGPDAHWRTSSLKNPGSHLKYQTKSFSLNEIHPINPMMLFIGWIGIGVLGVLFLDLCGKHHRVGERWLGEFMRSWEKKSAAFLESDSSFTKLRSYDATGDVGVWRGETTISQKMDNKEEHLRCLCPRVVTMLCHADNMRQPGSKYYKINELCCYLHGLSFSVTIVISREWPNDTSLFKYCLMYWHTVCVS